MMELSTHGAKFMLDGNEFHIKGTNWRGAETHLDRVPLGLHRHPISFYAHFLKANGFNTVRLHICHASVLQGRRIEAVTADGEEHIDAERSLLGLTYVEMLLSVSTTLANHGILVILVASRLEPAPAVELGSWYSEHVPLVMVKLSWERLAQTLCKAPNIIGADLVHEPFAADWGSEDPLTDWHLGAEDLGNHVLTLCPVRARVQTACMHNPLPSNLHPPTSTASTLQPLLLPPTNHHPPPHRSAG